MNTPLYLDYNATTPVEPEVLAAMLPYLKEHFGNPSSTHSYGAKAREALEGARAQVAALLNCSPGEIVFTSGGTESNNHAIRGITQARRSRGNHIVTSQVEHPSVLEVCKYLEKFGFEYSCLPVDEHGCVTVKNVERMITPRTALISIMHANNEVGTIEPIEEIAAMAREKGIIFHTDAAQSVGKIPVDVKRCGVDMLSFAGHKLYAPKGVGVLYIREGLAPERYLHGASHEEGRRAGTENVASIVALGKACEIAARTIEKYASSMKLLRDRLYEGLRVSIKDIRLNGHPERRLPNTANISFLALEAHTLLAEIKAHVAASPGAACHSGAAIISPVLRAMGIPPEWAKGAVRFSLGRTTTSEEIDRVITVLSDAIARLRR
jgi:cysteine desulfurase